jgi:hypothetical protein
MGEDKTVFLSEYISEDTNPWDSRERYGIYSDFHGASQSLKFLWGADTEGRWVSTDTYGGSNYGKHVRAAWKWCSRPDEDGEYYDHGDGYGLYIWEEYLDHSVEE